MRCFSRMKKPFLPLLIICYFQVAVNAQELKDFAHMKTAFTKATSDTAKLRMLFTKGPMTYMSHPNELLELYQQGYDIAKRQNDKSARFKALHYKALTYMYGKSNEKEAYQWLQKALIEAQSANNNLFIGWVYYAMGIIHHHQGNRQEMYKAFYQSVSYLEKAPDPVTGPFLSLSQNLDDDKKWDDQLSINIRMVALMEKTKVPVKEKLTAYNSLVDALKHFPNQKKDFTYFRQKALTLLDSIPPSGLNPNDLLIIASIFHKFERSDLAINQAQKVVNWVKNDGFLPEKGLAHKFLSELYYEQKKYQKAIDHLKQYQLIEIEQVKNRLKDDAGKQIIKAQAESDLALKQNEIEKQQLYTYLSNAVAILVILMSIVIYYFYHREQRQKRELTQLNATKDKLFAILSHDLRSPVGALENNVMLTHWGALTQEEFVEATQNLGQEIRQVRTMLDNVLHWSISQLGGMKPHPKRLSLNEAIHEQLALLRPAADAKGIALRQQIKESVFVNADKNHLAIIFRNLLQNAIKFTRSAGAIDLLHHEDNAFHHIQVKDTGIGMSPQQLAQLFQLGEQNSRQGTSSENGTGLGLVLVKELVEANGGSIDVTSHPDEGTSFSLRFPK